MGTPIYFTKTLAAANDAIVAASQTPSGAGDLTLVGSGTVSLDTPRQVILTFAANETGHSFVIYGNQNTDGTGNAISETIAGTTAGIVASTRMYGQVTRISISAAATGALKAGTNGVGASPWVSSNYQISPANWSIGCTVTGTVNYTLQYTYGDFWTVTAGTTQGAVPTAISDAVLVSKTATADTVIGFPITGWRLLVNSGTGSVAVAAVQAGIRGN